MDSGETQSHRLARYKILFQFHISLSASVGPRNGRIYGQVLRISGLFVFISVRSALLRLKLKYRNQWSHSLNLFSTKPTQLVRGLVGLVEHNQQLYASNKQPLNNVLCRCENHCHHELWSWGSDCIITIDNLLPILKHVCGRRLRSVCYPNYWWPTAGSDGNMWPDPGKLD